MISMLAVLLGVSLIYALGYRLKPNSSTQINTMSPIPQYSGPQQLGHLPIPFEPHLYIFAYSDDGFVQASVTITGPESPNPPFDNGAPINASTLNGTTSTNLQNPLRFRLWPGVYSVSGTYGSASPRNVIVNATEPDSYGEVVLNFGSSSPPPLGHIIVSAWYWSETSGSFVQASVTITGPESLNGTIRDDYLDPSVFTVEPGVYSLVGTYGLAPPQNATVNITARSFAGLIIDFSPYPIAW
jgi:hypothetical protein